MASVRASVRQRARELAHGCDPHTTTHDVAQVPSTVIDQLDRIARRAEEPASTLRWAWRVQRASYLDSRRATDGVASTYLLATLLAAERHRAAS